MDKQIQFNNANGEIAYRAGELPNLAKKVRDEAITITGNTGTVCTAMTKEPLKSRLEFLENNKGVYFNNDLYIEYDLERLEIFLKVGFNMGSQDLYISRLKSAEILERFGINTDVTFNAKELSNLIKMNRSYFESKKRAMEIVSQLQNFKAKVNQEIENIDDQRGNKRYLKDQVIESNVPESFDLEIPIFLGVDHASIEVEILVEPDSMEFSLISPDLSEKQQSRGADIINNELAQIAEKCPGIKIYDIT